jgi:hypothetical protein
MADGIVPAIIWVVLFGGAFLTIGFTSFSVPKTCALSR